MIVFSNVSKSFGDQKTAIENFSLQINEGDFLVITGPSGVGKTTLMKLLIGEYKPSEGEIHFNGQNLAEIKSKNIPQLRRNIGIVFQDYKLIPEMNVWENVALPLYIQGKKDSEIEARVTDLLNLVELSDKALFFPSQLSGGEAQRISIARALATAPKVIFADEPTGNLDSESSINITKLLKKINQLGTTLLFATHDSLVLKELANEKLVKLEKKIVKEIEKVEKEIEKTAKKIDLDEKKDKKEEEIEEIEKNNEKNKEKNKKKKTKK